MANEMSLPHKTWKEAHQKWPNVCEQTSGSATGHHGYKPRFSKINQGRAL
jgi:hypothetical protein